MNYEDFFQRCYKQIIRIGRNTKMKANCMNDKELLRNCLQGEVEEFRNIVDRYRGKTMAMAMNILGNREDAEDACQEAFIQVYHNLDKFDFQKNFGNWLYSILYKRCLDLIRKRRRFYRFFNKKKREFLDSMDNKNLKPDNKPLLSGDLLQMLNPKERIALCLWANEGYTSEEVASVLKCSSSTARVHLFKARKKTKALLEKENVSMQDY